MKHRAPKTRVMGQIEKLDDKKDIVTIVDVGAGNGRNSIEALLQVFKEQAPAL